MDWLRSGLAEATQLAQKKATEAAEKARELAAQASVQARALAEQATQQARVLAEEVSAVNERLNQLAAGAGTSAVGTN
jgi:hypothetical protein